MGVGDPVGRVTRSAVNYVILSYRELIVTLTKSLNRTTFPLKYIVYYLGFYINLISIERAISARIYYNSKNGILEEKNRKPI
jgi:hypothetical protein